MTHLIRRLLQPAPHECEKARNLFSDYLDGDLDPKQRQGVEEHVSLCPRCRQVLSNLRHTVSRLGRLSETPPPGTSDADEVGDRLRRAWRDRS